MEVEYFHYDRVIVLFKTCSGSFFGLAPLSLWTCGLRVVLSTALNLKDYRNQSKKFLSVTACVNWSLLGPPFSTPWSESLKRVPELRDRRVVFRIHTVKHLWVNTNSQTSDSLRCALDSYWARVKGHAWWPAAKKFISQFAWLEWSVRTQSAKRGVCVWRQTGRHCLIQQILLCTRWRRARFCSRLQLELSQQKLLPPLSHGWLGEGDAPKCTLCVWSAICLLLMRVLCLALTTRRNEWMNKWMTIYVWRIKSSTQDLACSQRQIHTVPTFRNNYGVKGGHWLFHARMSQTWHCCAVFWCISFIKLAMRGKWQRFVRTIQAAAYCST